MTVRQAVNNLVNDGYLVRRRGKGTFVAAKKIEQPLKGLTSFSEDMRARGMEPDTVVLGFETQRNWPNGSLLRKGTPFTKFAVSA